MSEKQEVGALWEKTSERTGNRYLTGEVDVPGAGTIKVVAFYNDRRENDRQPAIRIYLQEDRGGNRGSGSGRPYQRPAAPPRRETPPPPPEKKIEYPTEDIDPDDIPF